MMRCLAPSLRRGPRPGDGPSSPAPEIGLDEIGQSPHVSTFCGCAYASNATDMAAMRAL